MDGYVCIGKITKTHGYNGSVTVSLDVDYPEDFEEMESVFLEYNGKLVPFFVKEASYAGKTNLRILFEDYKTDKSIGEFVGCSMYLPDDLLPAKSDSSQEFNGFIIYNTETGEKIGTVIGIEENPAHPLFIVKFGSKEIMIPAVEQLITSIDPKSKKISILIPEGLLDL